MKKTLIFIATALLLSGGAFAQGPKEDKKSESHLKFYGFIRTYFAFDTRESSAGTEDLYYYMPKDQNIVNGEDLNAIPSFRYATLTSRVGFDVTGYEVAGYKIGAKVETDFYAGVSGVTGTAQLRLRQAYVSVAKGARTWKVGQAWHPMAADLPDIFSLESGVPFGPFSRTPQVNFTADIGKGWSLTAAAIWQMQYTSTGPDGNSANYIKYGCTPELYLGFSHKGDGSLFRFGADLLSIKPRNYAYNVATGKAIGTVSDRLTTWSVFEFGQFKAGNWTIKEKVTYANDGSHFNMIGGYGVSKINFDGSWEYSATRNLSGWLTAQWKSKDSRWSPSFLLGYAKNFGTSKDIVGDFWCKNNANSLNQMVRFQPEVLYNLGKLAFGLEYMLTGVQYGSCGARKVATENLHWVFNNRVQMMVKFTF